MLPANLIAHDVHTLLLQIGITNQITYITTCYYAELAHKLSVSDLLLRLGPFVNPECNYTGESLFDLTLR